MKSFEPVPFHLPLPGADTIGLDGLRSISCRVHGMLHLDASMATLEWITTRHSEQVSFSSRGTITLHLRRRDRQVAGVMAAALSAAGRVGSR